jgi:hypothetical protein
MQGMHTLAPFARTTLPAHIAKPLGRPSEYRPEYCALVIEDMSAGFSLAAFAGRIGVSRDTVYEWCKRHAAFSDAVHRGQTGRQRAYESRLLTAQKGAEAAAAIFGLKNCAPQDWQEVRNVKHDHNHTLATLSDAQLLEIMGQSSDTSPDSVTIEGEVIQRNDR